MKKSPSKKKFGNSASLREAESAKGIPSLMPKLRFPEFSAQPYLNVLLGDVTEECAGRSGKKLTSAAIMGVSKSDGIVPMEERIIAKDTSRYKLLSLDWFAYNPMRINIGSIARWRGKNDVLVSPDYVVFRCIDDNGTGISADYLDQFRSSLQWEKFVTGSGDGGVRIRIYYKSLASLSLRLPSLPEQQKIADCLSSLDELIGAQCRKLDALRTYKKGLMQQLFPREGETQPRLRFPEFKDAGDWKIRQLSDFITERNEFPKEQVPLFSLTIEDGVTPKTERYERSFLVNNDTDAYKLVLPNDFAFNPMNLRFGAIGLHSGLEQVAVSKYYNIFFCDNSVDARFCETYFRSERMIAFYDERAIGTLIEKRRVHFASFMKFNIRFPSLPEQQRIASCLSSLDDLIKSESQKLEALKTHKRGLMQQLFPSPEDS